MQVFELKRTIMPVDWVIGNQVLAATVPHLPCDAPAMRLDVE